MKVTRVELLNFRSYRSLVVPLTSWRTLIIGRNGAGKSTLGQAIQWAITGRCPGLDGAGRGTAELKRQGHDNMSVLVDVAGLGTIIRTVDGKNTTLQIAKRITDGDAEGYDPIARGTVSDVQAAIYKKLHTREELLEAAVNSGAFLELEHGEAKDLLMRLLNVQVAVDQELRSKLAVLNDEDPPDYLTLSAVDELEKRARDKRLVAKQRVKDMGAPREPKLPDAIAEAPSAAELQTRLAKIKSSAAELFAADNQRAGQAKELTARKTRLERELADLDKNLAGVDVDQARERLEKIEADRAAAIGQVDRGKLDSLRQKIAESRGELNASEKLLLAVRKHSPAKGCILDASIPCKTPAKAFKDHLESIDAKRINLERVVASAEGEAKAIEVAASTLDGLDREEKDLRRRLEGFEKSEALRDEKRTEMVAVLADLENASAAPSPEIEKKRDEVTRVETMLQAWRDHDARVKAHQEAKEKIARFEKDVERLEELCAMLGPKGLRVDALRLAVDRFETKVNGFLDGWGFRIKLSIDPWGVSVNGRPSTMLSKSEKLRLGIGLQLAIVESSDLGFAFIDEADVLDKINNATLAKLLMTTGVGTEGSAGQVIVAATRDDDYTPPTLENLQVVRLAKEEVRAGELATAIAWHFDGSKAALEKTLAPA
jgi:DNA repair exonuclease SbcCD ATPase subunit